MPESGQDVRPPVEQDQKDKHLIHLGTKVKIGNIIYTAEDTGSAIKGKRIDVYYASHRKATAHGVKYQKIKVYI